MAIDWAERYRAVQERSDLEGAVLNGTVHPRWAPGSHTFWYDRQVAGDTEYRLVDADAGSNRLVTTHSEVVRALGAELGHDLDHHAVILRGVELSIAGDSVTFQYAARRFEFRVAERRLAGLPAAASSALVVSPDGARAMELRGYDLWLRDVAAGSSVAVTDDGEEYNAYGVGPAPMRSVYAKYQLMQAPDGLWSPDSRYFLTMQTDERHVPDLPSITYAPRDGGRPRATPFRTTSPGDARVTEYRLLVIDADTGRQTEAEYRRLTASRMMDTPFAAELAWWSADSRTAYFVDLERGERTATVVALDPRTGATRAVFSESAERPLELSVSLYDPALVIPLPATDELIWYSERSGRGHLYLYDVREGHLVRTLTEGDWQVREVLAVDPVGREVFFLAGGIAGGEDPYVRKPCSVPLDGGPTRVLDETPGDHRVWRPGEWGIAVLSRKTGADIGRVSGFAPDCSYFVDTVGAVDRMPITSLRTRDGELVCDLESADADALPSGWQWPVAVETVAADGVTTVYGLLFPPVGYEPGASYPLVDVVYGGPQESTVPKSAFVEYPSTCTFVEAAGYAALGAFALVLDGRGSASRERDFRQASYGAVQTSSNLDDHRAAIVALANAYPEIDLDRIGVTGFSGGGSLAAFAALQHGDFFSVAVAASGNYDIRLFWHGYGERYQGPYSPELYEQQAAKTYAAGLQGRLLLIHGLEDFGCSPAGLFQLVEALVQENKDFDLVTLPTAGHEITGYGMRRRLDYLVTHLFGATPPTPTAMADPRTRVMQREAANQRVLASIAAASAGAGALRGDGGLG